MNQKDALINIESWLSRQTKSYCLIAIAGGTCSGKTYFSHAVSRYFGDALVSLVQLDDYFKDIDDPTLPWDAEGYPLFDAPHSHHDDEFVEHIGILLSGHSVWTPSYDLATNKRICAKGRLVQPKRIIIGEGLHAMHLLNRWGINYHPLNIYVEVTDSVRLGRRVKRDMAAYGVPYRVVIDCFYDRLLPLHQRFVEPQRDKAHLIVEGFGD